MTVKGGETRLSPLAAYGYATGFRSGGLMCACPECGQERGKVIKVIKALKAITYPPSLTTLTMLATLDTFRTPDP